MNAPFPFGLPAATAFYLTLYVGTLLLHVITMNYVLAGATYLFFAAPMGARACTTCLWQKVLKDWMPFATGLAITAGVAPLLFLQILYQREFYTANLLLSHRWMLILPVLMACFYLLYVQKTGWLARQGQAAVFCVRLGIFAGFAFIAWSWTENHLLSLDADIWPDFFRQGRWAYWSPLLPSRLAMWFLGAFPTLACILMWQAAWTPHLTDVLDAAAMRRLAMTGMGGLCAAGIAAGNYLSMLPAEQRIVVFGWLTGPYLVIAMIGVGLQVLGWSDVWKRGQSTRFSRGLITSGCLFTLLGMTVVREGLRLSALSLEDLTISHAEARQVGGVVVFLVFLGVNAGLIAWSIAQVRARLRAETHVDSIPPESPTNSPPA